MLREPIFEDFALAATSLVSLQAASSLGRRTNCASYKLQERGHHRSVAQHCRNLRTEPAALALRSASATKYSSCGC